MHLSVKMIRQTTIIIQSTQIRSTHITHLQFLVARWTRGIRESLEFTLVCFLLVLCGANLVEFVQGHGNSACLAEDRDLQQTSVDSLRKIRYLL